MALYEIILFYSEWIDRLFIYDSVEACQFFGHMPMLWSIVCAKCSISYYVMEA